MTFCLTVAGKVENLVSASRVSLGALTYLAVFARVATYENTRSSLSRRGKRTNNDVFARAELEQMKTGGLEL